MMWTPDAVETFGVLLNRTNSKQFKDRKSDVPVRDNRSSVRAIFPICARTTVARERVVYRHALMRIDE
jgi:hypothetical protein